MAGQKARGKGRAQRVAGSRVGADEAFHELVHQFTDPLAFLRELVQNSLDAGSSRVDVRFLFEGGFDPRSEGLAVVEVEDNGEGMDERILDDYLLTLFSSSKEGDLAKIGKFGIGFVSIFAMQPELVLLETGRRGESWRLLFHSGGRYEKLRLDRAVEGTRVRLLKRMARAEFRQLEKRGKQVVRYWCRYAETLIRVDGEAVQQPFVLEADLAVHHAEEGTELWMGFGPLTASGPGVTVGFYNRGLTLLEADHLPGRPEDLRGLSLRVKSRYLEHTLTRDDVRQDENYDRLLDRVRAVVAGELRPRLVAHLVALARWASGVPGAEDPGPPGPEAAYACAALPCMDARRSLRDQPVVPVLSGEPLRPRDLERLHAPHGCLLAVEAPSPVTELLRAQGVTVLRDLGGLRALLSGLVAQEIKPVDQVVCTALQVPVAPAVAGLLQGVTRLLAGCGVRLSAVFLGDLGYPGSSVAGRLFLRQEQAFGLTRSDLVERPGLFGGARQVVLHRGHPLVARCLALAAREPDLAALLLAEAVYLAEGGAAARVAELCRAALTHEPRGGGA